MNLIKMSQHFRHFNEIHTYLMKFMVLLCVFFCFCFLKSKKSESVYLRSIKLNWYDRNGNTVFSQPLQYSGNGTYNLLHLIILCVPVFLDLFFTYEGSS